MATVRVDRLEDDVAVLAFEGVAFEVPRALVPDGAREGDVLAWRLDVDRAASEEARRRTQDRRERLSRGDDGGDFSL